MMPSIYEIYYFDFQSFKIQLVFLIFNQILVRLQHDRLPASSRREWNIKSNIIEGVFSIFTSFDSIFYYLWNFGLWAGLEILAKKFEGGQVTFLIHYENVIMVWILRIRAKSAHSNI